MSQCFRRPSDPNRSDERFSTSDRVLAAFCLTYATTLVVVALRVATVVVVVVVVVNRLGEALGLL